MRLRTPPSSLRKPHVSDTTPNRAFLRGFPVTQFPDFRLCGRFTHFSGDFGVLSPHPKIPFPATQVLRWHVICLLFGSLAIDWIIECAVAFGPQRPQ